MFDPESLKRLKAERKRWEEKVENALGQSPEKRREILTSSGIPVERIYTPESTAKQDYLQDQGFPGEYPYTRGVQTTMYRGRLWTMRQYAGFASAEESNQRYRYLLSQGQTGLSVAFDLPTQMGYDSDHPMVRGEVGRVGVAISSLQDMEILLAEIPLEKISISMTINATAAILLGMVIAVAERQGVETRNLQGTLQNDLLKEYVARGTYIYPPEPSLRISTDIISFCQEHMPRWNPISISGYHMREAGCTAVQEVAFTLANGIAYVEAARKAGLAVDDFAPRLSFFFNVHMNFLEEVAKFRAARRLWARIMKERFGARDENSCRLRFHAQTAGCTLTAQQPDNNVVRVTLQALAAVLGGVQSLHTNSKDEALALPSAEAALLALRTQQIIAYESGVADTADPLGGSYAVEALTSEIEERARDYLQRIDRMGGSLKAISFMQREIQEAAYRTQKAVERKEEIVVGVNEFVSADDGIHETLQIDPQVEERQHRKLAALRAGRDGAAVARALDELNAAAKTGANLVPPILQAVTVYATLGEIADCLRSVFGVYREQVVL
ncbi:MAG: methylmalonyl-CoA mutase family protein [Candidatus Tectomicrobia bacterium]|uniref:Methylmalonyl-CoA mutase family protein n=1 Tax=Tectimicrobiota bacterium TaxID=2528274 RepID=A0A932GMB9_UNCTE|nr:methylmalonyl-CoA mutase family protein [Candidatus Tectomicrobia bacterium]